MEPVTETPAVVTPAVETRTVTGHTAVMVKVADGEVLVRRGQPLPSEVTAAEVRRLEKVGAFDPAPVASRAGQGARPAAAAAATLSPEVTLAANPNPDGIAPSEPGPLDVPLVDLPGPADPAGADVEKSEPPPAPRPASPPPPPPAKPPKR